MKYGVVVLLENNLDYIFCFLTVNIVHLVVKFSFQSILTSNWHHTHARSPCQ